MKEFFGILGFVVLLVVIILVGAYFVGSVNTDRENDCKRLYGNGYVANRTHGADCIAPDGTGRFLR